MTDQSTQKSSRNRNIVIAVIILIIIVLLLLTKCLPKKTPVTPPPGPAPAPTTPTNTPPAPAAVTPPAPKAEEVLTPATITAPAHVAAGIAFTLEWTGPNNPGDYISIAKADAPPAANTKYYREVKPGEPLQLTAPIEPGAYELRYVTARSHTILGRAPITIDPITASVDAPAEVVLGSTFTATWTGPNNQGDYVTIVKKDAPDDRYQSYVETSKGTTITLSAPTETGAHEVRYVTGDGRKVLARRDITVTSPAISITAPDQTIAGSQFELTWTGPNNKGDYITIVKKGTPDGQYGKYANTSVGSPMKLLTPIMDGDAELRYSSGQGNKVLFRRPIKVVAATITLAAPPEVKPEAPVSITWTGPNHPGDYITIVKKGTPDGQYGKYADATKGSPLTIPAPKEPGEIEIRYCSNQNNAVLFRITIKVVP